MLERDSAGLEEAEESMREPEEEERRDPATENVGDAQAERRFESTARLSRQLASLRRAENVRKAQALHARAHRVDKAKVQEREVARNAGKMEHLSKALKAATGAEGARAANTHRDHGHAAVASPKAVEEAGAQTNAASARRAASDLKARLQDHRAGLHRAAEAAAHAAEVKKLKEAHDIEKAKREAEEQRKAEEEARTHQAEHERLRVRALEAAKLFEDKKAAAPPKPTDEELKAQKEAHDQLVAYRAKQVEDRKLAEAAAAAAATAATATTTVVPTAPAVPKAAVEASAVSTEAAGTEAASSPSSPSPLEAPHSSALRAAGAVPATLLAALLVRLAA